MKHFRQFAGLALWLLSTAALADTIGNTNIGASGTRALDEVIRGIEVTMPSGTFAASVTLTAYLTNPSGTEAFTCAVYGSAANNAALLAESAARTDITSAGWYTFSGGTLASFTPSATTTYIIVCGSYSNADATINYDDGAGRNQSISGVAPIVMTVEPMNSDLRTHSVYMTYSVASSGALLLRRRRT
jgi:hypothetical protein